MIIIVYITKIISFLLNLVKISGGTSLPGLLIENYFPHIITKLSKQYKVIVLITGTNGKTSTQRILAHILTVKDMKVNSNKSGANLLRGIITSVINDTNLLLRIKCDIAIFEVEEASLPILTKYIKSDFIVVTNIFRDQLDLYGELVKTRNLIVEGIKNNLNSHVFLNKDDPYVTSIKNDINNTVTYYKIKDKRKKNILYEILYKTSRTQKVDRYIYARDIILRKDLSSTFYVYGLDKKSYKISINNPGIENIYNTIAALSVAFKIVKLSDEDLNKAFLTLKQVFGRGEIIKIGEKVLRLFLIKNPASFTSNLETIKNINVLKLMIIINNKIADGKDVSWLWDVKFSVLKRTNISWVIISGKRAYDMDVRLKYTDLNLGNIETETNLNKAFDIALSKLSDGETLFILPNYTAMLEIRKIIGQLVKVDKY